ncbi:MAG: hypothetical protein ACI857_000813 [Arenicella sp.]|jgi:hypothetical protein
MSKVVIEISTETVLTKDDLNGVVEHSRGKFPDLLFIGDIVQYSEHGFHDVIDEEGNHVWRYKA